MRKTGSPLALTTFGLAFCAISLFSSSAESAAAPQAGVTAPQVPTGISPDVSKALKEQQAVIAKLTDEITRLSIEVRVLKLRLELVGMTYNSAIFDPTSTSFQRIDSSSGGGTFFVSVQDVKPFGDGVRVKLNIGNPSTADYSGVKLELRYGPRSPKDDDSDPKALENWASSIKRKEETLSTKVIAGNWNPIYVNLPDTKPEQFGYLAISLMTGQISLRPGE